MCCDFVCFVLPSVIFNDCDILPLITYNKYKSCLYIHIWKIFFLSLFVNLQKQFGSVIMRRESENWSAYRQLRDELLNSIRDQEVDITGLKAEFAARGGRKVLSRRRLEAIRSMSQMIEECEHHLLISPDKRGIKYFKKLVEFVKCRSSQLIR